MVPYQKRDAAVARRPRGRVEVVALVKGGNASTLDVDANQVVNGFRADQAVSFPHCEQGPAIPGQVGETLGGVALGDPSRRLAQSGRRRYLVDVLVCEVHEVDMPMRCPAIGDAVGAATVFVDPAAWIEGRRRQFPYGVRNPKDQGGTTSFLGPGLLPEQRIGTGAEFAVALGSPGDDSGIDGRPPTPTR